MRKKQLHFVDSYFTWITPFLIGILFLISTKLASGQCLTPNSTVTTAVGTAGLNNQDFLYLSGEIVTISGNLTSNLPDTCMSNIECNLETTSGDGTDPNSWMQVGSTQVTNTVGGQVVDHDFNITPIDGNKYRITFINNSQTPPADCDICDDFEITTDYVTLIEESCDFTVTAAENTATQIGDQVSIPLSIDLQPGQPGCSVEEVIINFEVEFPNGNSSNAGNATIQPEQGETSISFPVNRSIPIPGNITPNHIGMYTFTASISDLTTTDSDCTNLCGDLESTGSFNINLDSCVRVIDFPETDISYDAGENISLSAQVEVRLPSGCSPPQPLRYRWYKADENGVFQPASLVGMQSFSIAQAGTTQTVNVALNASNATAELTGTFILRAAIGDIDNPVVNCAFCEAETAESPEVTLSYNDCVSITDFPTDDIIYDVGNELIIPAEVQVNVPEGCAPMDVHYQWSISQDGNSFSPLGTPSTMPNVQSGTQVVNVDFVQADPGVEAAGIYRLDVWLGTLSPAATSDCDVCNSETAQSTSVNVLLDNCITIAPGDFTITGTCLGEDIVFSVDPEITVPLNCSSIIYLWQKEEGGNFNTIGNSSSPTFTLTGAVLGNSGDYRVVIQIADNPPNPGCTFCSESEFISSTASLEVVQLVTGVDITSSESTINCINNSVTISASPDDPMVTYTWTLPDNSTMTGNPLITTQIGQYSLTAEGPEGCVESFDNVISVAGDLSQPDLTISIEDGGSNTLDCERTMIELMAADASIPDAQLNYSWFKDGIEITPSPGSMLGVSEAGTYQVVAQHINSSCIDSTATMIDVDQAVPSASLDAEVVNCDFPERTISNESTSNSANPTTLSFAWTGVDLDGNPIDIPDDLINLQDLSVDQGGTYTVTVTDDANHCTTTEPIAVEEDKEPPVFTVESSQADPQEFRFCEGTSIDICVTTGDFPVREIRWNNDDMETGNCLEVSESSDNLVLVTRDDNGCSAEVTVTTTSIAAPEIVLPIEYKEPALSGTPAEFTLTLNPTDATVQWEISEYLNVNPLDPSMGEDNTDEFEFQFDLQNNRAPGSVKLTFTPYLTFNASIEPCQGDPASVALQVIAAELWIPDVVTPDAVSTPSFWDIYIPPDLPFSDFEVQIFNRSGGKVFESESVLNNRFTGNGCPNGTYYYVLTGNDDNRTEFKGAVTIVRNTN